MHVAIIIDGERLRHEQMMLNRLCVGLMAEGVRLTRVVEAGPWPDSIEAAEQRITLATRIETSMTAWPWVCGVMARQVFTRMRHAPPDVIYAVGTRAWRMGMNLGRLTNAQVVLDVWCASQVRRVPRGRRSDALSGYVAASRPIADAIKELVDPSLVSLVPTGIALPHQARERGAPENRTVGLAILGGCRDMPAYRAILGGLSRVLREIKSVHIFLELSGPHQHEIWREAQRLDLMKNVSAAGEASVYRSLLTRCDLILNPERFGELRSLILEAMGLGMPIIASEDPFLDMLTDGESAELVSHDDADEWAKRILGLLRNPERAWALGQRAREKVAKEHRLSEHVARLIRTFERLHRGGAYAFAQAGS